MNYKIGICDDELSVCNDLEQYILEFAKNYGYSIDVEVWNNAETCMSDLTSFKPDVLFLDIELPGDNGVSVGKYIRETLTDSSMVIVFISHKTNYAMELFQVHPYDFLIKPIERTKIFKVLEQLIAIYQTNSQKFIFTYKNETTRLLTGEIIYIKSMDKHVIIISKTGEYHYIGKLDDAERKLPSKSFTRISKSFLINMNFLKSVKSDLVTMSDGSTLNVSKSHQTAFRQAYMDYSMWGG